MKAGNRRVPAYKVTRASKGEEIEKGIQLSFYEKNLGHVVEAVHAGGGLLANTVDLSSHLGPFVGILIKGL